MFTLIAILWLISGIVLFFISDRIYPEEHRDPIGIFQLVIFFLGPICWTHMGVTSIILIHKRKSGEYVMDYWTSWIIFIVSCVLWFLILTILAKC